MNMETTVPPRELTLAEKQEMLRKILAERISRTRTASASFAQERLWFLDRMEPGSAAYNLPAALRLRGALDAPALERALAEVVRRHETLRTTFREDAGAAVQVIAPFAAFTLPVHDLSGMAEAEREAEVRRRAGADAERPFDLQAGPLFRAELLKLAADEHVLLLCMHHIVGDGWSTGVLFRELSAAYAAFAAGQESPLPRLTVQYADYAERQRAQLQGGGLERQIGWWKDQLAGAPALLELPTDRPRPAVRTEGGASASLELSPELTAALHALARREGATLYMVLLAAFQVLLGRYAGTEDVVVGSPIAGRTRTDVEALIGFFVNTLVLRTDLSGDPAFRELLGRVRAATLGAYENQEVPFEKLVAELQPERSLSHSPLFQVLFTLQNAADGDAAGVRMGDVDAVRFGAEGERAKFDLSLSMNDRGGALRGSLQYSTDLFERATVQRMLGHLERILAQVAADADVRLSGLQLLTETERGTVVEAWNRTDAEYPAGAAIHQLFEAQAERTPDAVAAVCEHDALTYAELNARANRLAHHLRALGVGPEVRVGICLHRSLDLLVSLLAVMKAGGAYVPLDPAYPAERLEMILSDAGAPVLVTQETLRGTLPLEAGVAEVVIDRDAELIAARPASNPRSGVTARNLAYLIYTSGSTGRPKGVAIEHESAVVMLAWAWGVYTDQELSGMLAATSICFDLSVFELFLPLSRGGRVIMVENALALPASAARDQVRLLNTVPSAAAALVKTGGIPAGVRTINLAGEPLKTELVDALYATGTVERVYDLYGPSEDTTYSTYTLRAAGAPANIGRAIANSQAYVLNAGLDPVPVGVVGELYLGGLGVTRGYLGRPSLTAERYVPDHLGDKAGARLYRTGDKVRWNADGTLQYLGRLDEQVKVRGYRIELGEIEAGLRRAGATDCVVVARADDAGEKRIVAYVVGAVDADELRAALRRTLPEYMVPAAFVKMDALPLHPNGKLNKKALPAPVFAAAEDAYVAPRTPVEEVLAGIWAELLKLDRVGVAESFFELGGHSLLATRVISRIREALAVELPLRALFEAPTVAELAERVEALRRADAPALPAIVPVERTDALPLSFAQERLWFLDRMEGSTGAYAVPAALRLTGALDAAALERALGEIVRRHEALRTVFREIDGAAAQVVQPFAGFVLPLADLRGMDADAREAEVRRAAAADAERTFDLAAGPVFRASLLRLADDEHVLLLCMHHVVSDAWSMGVLFRELSALYGAFAAGGESPLAPLPVQYADFAAWQRTHLQGPALDAQLGWWKEQLGGAPALLELPTDHPRPAVQSYRGAREAVALSPALTARLEALARAEGATLYMVLLGAFQLLLGRYAGADDVVVGSPIAGRTRRETEELIGFFVNTLALRTDLSGDPTFRQLLGRVRQGTLGAYEHQEVPFEKLVAELQPERTLSHSPLFQVMFILQNVERGGRELPGLAMERLDGGSGSTKFDLSLALRADEGGLRGSLEYATDLFDAGTIRRMLGHLERVLAQVAENADVRLSGLSLLTETERGTVVEAWNRTDAEYPAGAAIHQLFEAQAERTPDAVAAVCEHDALTYAELNARANRLAHHLRALGVGPEVRVGICLHRSLDLLVSLLAVMKAGGAYVPLDPAYPAERLEMILSDAGAPVLVTQEALRGMLPLEAGVAEVVIDRDAQLIAGRPAENPASGVTARNLAYLIYTSGSTGRPKGVAIEHESAVVMMAWGWNTYSAEELGGMLASTSICFDMSVFELFTPLARGGRVIIVENALALPASAARDQVRVIDTVPSAAATLLKTGGIPANVITVGMGGEPLKADLVDGLYAIGVRRVLDLYGPSEDTTFSTWAERTAGGPVTIGRILTNSQAYVLDAGLNPVPVSVVGELYLGGLGVTRGYLGRPSLTAERYVPDHVGGRAGARLYRTGDKVRWNADGTLQYLGRLDEQVKVRGYRIELGEIEAGLRRAGATDCVVVARADDAGEKRIVAYVVGAVEADELRAALRRTLPEYMVPAAFVKMDALPLHPNGKLNKKALPAPVFSASEDAYVAPRTPVQEVLAGIWAELLKLDRVGVAESFFELGGHSLLATRVISRIREALAVELPLRALFEAPTVAELAERVEALRRADAPALPAIVPVERTDALPLSFAQERLWFLGELEGAGSAYNIPVPVRLTGALDAAALERALGEVVRRHEALRTTFRQAGDAPVQVIAPFAGLALATGDLRGMAADAREAEMRRRAAQDAARPFDLAAGPLFRASLLRLADDEHVLLICMHHAVGDGWSTGVLFRELSALYAAFAAGQPSPLAELPVQYADFAVWQREHLQGQALDRQLGWWKEQLAGAPALLELPTDRPRPAVQSYRGARESVVFPPALLAGLEAAARAEGATLYMVLLAAFQVLLGRYAGADDVVVGSPIAGRTRAETEALIGFFVNTLVLRTDLSGDPTFRQLLGRVRQATLGAYEHQEVPFEKLVAELQPERSLSHSPLFQVMFILQNVERGGLELPGVRMQGVSAEGETAKFDLSLALGADERGLAGSITYSTDLFEAGTIRRMLGHLERILAQVAENVDVRLSGLEMLTATERGTVVEAWNRTDAEYPAGAAIHQLFEAQAERTPDAVAAVCEHDALTYAELNARANRLAHHLRALGVVPEVRVGICLHRSLDLLVSLLAVMKAGGAYVPLDPAYPAERLEMILSDAGAPVLVTEEKLRGLLPLEAGVAEVVVDRDAEPIAGRPASNPQSGVTARNLAYLIYTSGSTGRPKGVAIEHESAVVMLAWAWGVYTDQELSGMLAATSICFDLSVFELFLPLSRGGRVIMVENALALPASAARDQVRLLNTVPSAAAALVKTGGIPAGVRTINLAGEPLKTELVDALYATGTVERVYDLYGPSEDTTYSTYTLRAAGAPANIGRAIANSQAYVLNAGLDPVPVGVVGELYLGGLGVTRGYLGRPSLTAERYVPDHLGDKAGARLYRTGDKVRWNADGTLQYLGRLDEQVKVRGYRIELGEIEAGLRRAGATDCVVVARADDAGEKRIVAYVVGAVEADELRAALRRTLPEYMVPAAFVKMDALPLHPNGKLNKKALPAPVFAASEDAYVAPRTPVEEVLAGIWADVLGLDRVGVTDNFFALGGHSLLATRVVSRIRQEMDADLRVVALFETPTIAELAGSLTPRAAAAPEAVSAADLSPNRLLAMMDDLSEEELMALLAEAV
jgi:amino acid adenylation domain-containing protein